MNTILSSVIIVGTYAWEKNSFFLFHSVRGMILYSVDAGDDCDPPQCIDSSSVRTSEVSEFI